MAVFKNEEQRRPWTGGVIFSLVIFAPSEAAEKHVLLKEDWSLCFAKAAAVIIVWSLWGAALMTDFYNISFRYSTFPLKL